MQYLEEQQEYCSSCLAQKWQMRADQDDKRADETKNQIATM